PTYTFWPCRELYHIRGCFQPWAKLSYSPIGSARRAREQPGCQRENFVSRSLQGFTV
ncbi:hypothetical protein PENNAL_c0658G04590, partial [Penicillium nalgiovense]